MTFDELVLPPLRQTTVVSGLVGMSGGHCTHPTGGPANRLKYTSSGLNLYAKTPKCIVIPPNSNTFLIGGERVTCHWLKLHNSLGKQQLELSTRT